MTRACCLPGENRRGISVSNHCFSLWVLSIHSTWFHPLVSYHATSMCLLSHNTLEISGFSGLQLWRPEMDCQLMSTIRRHGLGCLLLWGVLWYCEQKWGSLAGMRHWFNLQHYLKNNNNNKKNLSTFSSDLFFQITHNHGNSHMS